MNFWRIGSNWDPDNLLPTFKKHRIAFAGPDADSSLKRVQPGDLVVITNGKPIKAIGKVDRLIDLSSIEGGYDKKYDDVLAIKFDKLYFADDFRSIDFGEYGGQGKEFHQAHGNYPKEFTALFKKINQSLMDKKYTDLLIAAGNLILTGAPGTGKTYLAHQIAEQIILTPEKQDHIEETAFEDYRKFAFDPEEVKAVDQAWRYWKSRILSPDFKLDDFANVLGNIHDPQVFSYGGYLMNFLERTSSKVYGSSKPGNADNYGIKMNADHSYGFYDSDEIFEREQAEERFNREIKPWMQSLLQAGFDQQILLANKPPALIKSRQLIRKMLVLEHPTKLLCTYQDKTIANAYRYFVKGPETDYFKQNQELLAHLFALFHLTPTKEHQFQIQHFVWHFFSDTGTGDFFQNKQGLTHKYVNEYSQFVQFHPSYDYTDFFDGLRPVRKEDQQEIGFELKNGTFKSFCLKAKQAYAEDIQKGKPVRRFVFIIDEINRAEIAKVFGELFFAIDPGYRGITGMVSTQYANIQTEETCFTDVTDDRFYVPENVYIIGTMNDIDRSVESFDFAMRRRFAWMEITADERMGMWDGKIDDYKDEAGRKMGALNKAIKAVNGLSASYHIGPAYFLKLTESKGSFEQLWDFHIGVILKEYLRGMPNATVILSNLKDAYDRPGTAV